MLRTVLSVVLVGGLVATLLANARLRADLDRLAVARHGRPFCESS